MTALWISHPHRPDLVDQKRPTTLLRRDLTLTAPPERATLRLTAQGVIEAYINGDRVGRDELIPGFTEYASRIQVFEYDITGQLRPGPNSVVLEVSDGWYSGAVGMLRARDQWGDRTAAWAEIDVVTSDGMHRISTDREWLCAVSGHRADMIHGEDADLRDYRPGEATSTLDWVTPDVSEANCALIEPDCAPVRIARQLEPVELHRTPQGWLVDFGENIAGAIELDRLGPTGNRLRFVHGEVLDAAGELTLANITPQVPFLPHPLQAGQIDEVVSGGAGTIWRPRHSTKGFRFVRIEGDLDEDSAGRIRANVFHTDLTEVGSFDSASDDLNWLYAASRRSFLGNAIDIPTDCPTRERAGWTADWDVFFPTARLMFDVDAFTRKWLRDLAARQWANGVIGNMAPMPAVEGEGSPMAFANGSAGWGDAIVSVPWTHYETYGDLSVLHEFWPHMERWLSYVESRADGQRHADRIARSAVAQPHERYLWDTGFQFGEWFEPDDADVDFAALSHLDHGPTATAFFRRTTSQMAAIADLLGRHARATELRELSERIRDAWRTEFLVDGLVRPARQAHCVRALAFDLLEPGERPLVEEQLARLVTDAGGHLGTGFLATPHLLPTLAASGHPELAWDVLTTRSWPSWLRMRDAGATTVWERWEGYDSVGEPIESHNHYSKGAVSRYLVEHIAGLRRVPARTDAIVFAPEPPPDLAWAAARHMLPAGEVGIHWWREGEAVIVETSVAPGVTAELRLPDADPIAVTGVTRTRLALSGATRHEGV